MSVDRSEAIKLIGARLRMLRGGRSIRAQAALLGVTAAALGSWERGDREPGVLTLMQIAAHHDVPAAALLPGGPLVDPRTVDALMAGIREAADRIEEAMRVERRVVASGVSGG